VVDVLAQDFFACIDEQGDNPYNSVVGAHYYLEVRHLLQTKSDSEIKKQDYIEIVRRVANDFLAGVQRNRGKREAHGPADDRSNSLSVPLETSGRQEPSHFTPRFAFWVLFSSISSCRKPKTKRLNKLKRIWWIDLRLNW